jgi:hypothetical protein
VTKSLHGEDFVILARSWSLILECLLARFVVALSVDPVSNAASHRLSTVDLS